MPRQATTNPVRVAVACAVVLLGAGLAGCQRDSSTATLLADAKQYQQKGDKKAALIQLKNAVAKSPQDGEARMALGSLHLEMGDPVSAEKELRKAATLGIPANRTLAPLASALLAQGQFDKLLEEVTPEKAQGNADLLTRRGDALLALRKHDEAKQAYEQALAAKPAAGEARIGLARLAMLDKDLDAARRYVNEAADAEPKNADIWIFKGNMLRGDGKTAEALAAYDRAIAAQPDHRSAHLEKAFLEIGMSKFDAAKADLDAARKITPGSLMVIYTQALLDFNQGSYAAAQDSLQKILKAAPEHMPSILLAASVELKLGSLQQAEQHLRKYLEANPNDVYARKQLAQTLLKGAQPVDAAAALAPALKEPTQDPQLLALAGESALKARDFDKASAYFEKASSLAPKVAALHTSLGLSRLGQGDRDKGVSELELAATIDPKSPNAGIALVQAELGLKRYDRALAAVQALEKQQPDNAEVQNLKGLVYVSKGDRAAARAAFDKAVTLQPSYFAAVSNLARMDLQDKQPEVAKKRFEAVLAKEPKNFAAMAALAEIATVAGKPDEATTWLEKASNENPDAVAPALKLGGQYLGTKQPQKAQTLARKFLAANPTNADLLDMLGYAQLTNNDAAGALETYSKLVNVLPKSAMAQMRLAAAHTALKNDAAAGEDLKRAVELQPDMLQAQVALAGNAMRRGKPDEALAIARTLQKQPAPGSAVGYSLEGELLLGQNKAAQAVPAYQKSYEIVKTPGALIKLAEVMKQAGKAKDAQPLLAQWQSTHPADIVVPMFVAEQQLADKQYKPAIAALEGVLKRSPNNAVALNNLAWAYQQEKDPRALATAEQALKVGGNSPSVMDTVGWLLVEQGNTGRGVPLLRKAAELAPNAPDIHYHLAVGLSKTGDKAGARKELDKLLAQNKPFAQLDDARALLKTL
jgi:putative PEP-CTERM system TPR-repeat lipoprotein